MIGGFLKMDFISYLFTFIEGFLSFISPCILPMLPIYFLYLTGTASEENLSKKNLFLNSTAFVIGFTVVFVLMGATVTTISSILTSHRDILRILSGSIMILFGLNFAGILKIGLLNKEKRLQINVGRINFLKAIIFGIAFGFGWTPCLGAFLGSALAMAGNSKTIYQGMMLLFTYSIGLGIPFIISSLIFDSVRDLFKSLQKYSKIISIASGIFLIVIGLIYIDPLKYFN
jgi:cytochrome c-type biogenesis protein